MAKAARTWNLQDAKNKFSAVVEAARRDGPQAVTRRGAPAVVIVAAEEFARLSEPTGARRPNFAEFLLSIPKGPPIKRMKVRLRDIDL